MVGLAGTHTAGFVTSLTVTPSSLEYELGTLMYIRACNTTCTNKLVCVCVCCFEFSSHSIYSYC